MKIIYLHIRSDTDTDSDDSDVECIENVPAQTIDITNDEEIHEFLESCEGNTQGAMKTKGELGMDDLPPIAELTITVPESECVELGNITSIVDTLGKLTETQFHKKILPYFFQSR